MRARAGFAPDRLAALLAPVALAAALLASPANPAKADSGHPGGDYPLHCAAGIDNDLAAVNHLLGSPHNISLEARGPSQPDTLRCTGGLGNNHGQTPLHSAVFRGRATIIATLIAAGANPNAKDNDQDTPLHWAVWGAQASVMAALIAAGANLNAKNDDGDTPLHFAALHGRPAAAAALIAARADVNAKNDNGRTPLRETWVDSHNRFLFGSGASGAGLAAVMIAAGGHWGQACAGPLTTNPAGPTPPCACEAPNTGTANNCQPPNPGAQACAELTPPKLHDPAAGECVPFSAEACDKLTPPMFYDSAAGECVPARTRLPCKNNQQHAGISGTCVHSDNLNAANQCEKNGWKINPGRENETIIACDINFCLVDGKQVTHQDTLAGCEIPVQIADSSEKFPSCRFPSSADFISNGVVPGAASSVKIPLCSAVFGPDFAFPARPATQPPSGHQPYVYNCDPGSQNPGVLPVTVNLTGETQCACQNPARNPALGCLPTTPGKPTLTALQNGGVSLRWNPATLTAAAVTAHNILRKTSTLNFITIAANAPARNNFVDANPPANPATIQYRIQAVSPAGNSALSPPSDPQIAPTACPANSAHDPAQNACQCQSGFGTLSVPANQCQCQQGQTIAAGVGCVPDAEAETAEKCAAAGWEYNKSSQYCAIPFTSYKTATPLSSLACHAPESVGARGFPDQTCVTLFGPQIAFPQNDNSGDHYVAFCDPDGDRGGVRPAAANTNGAKQCACAAGAVHFADRLPRCGGCPADSEIIGTNPGDGRLICAGTGNTETQISNAKKCLNAGWDLRGNRDGGLRCLIPHTGHPDATGGQPFNWSFCHLTPAVSTTPQCAAVFGPGLAFPTKRPDDDRRFVHNCEKLADTFGKIPATANTIAATKCQCPNPARDHFQCTPGAPTIGLITHPGALTDDEIRFFFSGLSLPDGTILGYEILLETNRSGNFVSVTFLGGASRDYNVAHLRGADPVSLRFKIRAHSDAGPGPLSKIFGINNADDPNPYVVPALCAADEKLAQTPDGRRACPLIANADAAQKCMEAGWAFRKRGSPALNGNTGRGGTYDGCMIPVRSQAITFEYEFCLFGLDNDRPESCEYHFGAGESLRFPTRPSSGDFTQFVSNCGAGFAPETVNTGQTECLCASGDTFYDADNGDVLTFPNPEFRPAAGAAARSSVYADFIDEACAAAGGTLASHDTESEAKLCKGLSGLRDGAASCIVRHPSGFTPATAGDENRLCRDVIGQCPAHLKERPRNPFSPCRAARLPKPSCGCSAGGDTQISLSAGKQLCVTLSAAEAAAEKCVDAGWRVYQAEENGVQQLRCEIPVASRADSSSSPLDYCALGSSAADNGCRTIFGDDENFPQKTAEERRFVFNCDPGSADDRATKGLLPKTTNTAGQTECRCPAGQTTYRFGDVSSCSSCPATFGGNALPLLPQPNGDVLCYGPISALALSQRGQNDLNACLRAGWGIRLEAAPGAGLVHCRIPTLNHAAGTSASECGAFGSGAHFSGFDLPCSNVFGATLSLALPTPAEVESFPDQAVIWNCDPDGDNGLLPATANTVRATECRCFGGRTAEQGCPPGAPVFGSNPTFAFAQLNRISFRTGPVASHGGNLLGFEIFREDRLSGSFVSVAFLEKEPGGDYAETFAVGGFTIRYQIRARSDRGVGPFSEPSAPFYVPRCGTDFIEDGAGCRLRKPGRPQASLDEANRVELGWTSATTTVSPVSHYEVWRRTGSGFSGSYVSVGVASGPSFRDDAPPEGAILRYRARAVFVSVAAALDSDPTPLLAIPSCVSVSYSADGGGSLCVPRAAYLSGAAECAAAGWALIWRTEGAESLSCGIPVRNAGWALADFRDADECLLWASSGGGANRCDAAFGADYDFPRRTGGSQRFAFNCPAGMEEVVSGGGSCGCPAGTRDVAAMTGGAETLCAPLSAAAGAERCAAAGWTVFRGGGTGGTVSLMCEVPLRRHSTGAALESCALNRVSLVAAAGCEEVWPDLDFQARDSDKFQRFVFDCPPPLVRDPDYEGGDDADDAQECVCLADDPLALDVGEGAEPLCAPDTAAHSAGEKCLAAGWALTREVIATITAGNNVELKCAVSLYDHAAGENAAGCAMNRIVGHAPDLPYCESAFGDLTDADAAVGRKVEGAERRYAVNCPQYQKPDPDYPDPDGSEARQGCVVDAGGACGPRGVFSISGDEGDEECGCHDDSVCGAERWHGTPYDCVVHRGGGLTLFAGGVLGCHMPAEAPLIACAHDFPLADHCVDEFIAEDETRCASGGVAVLTLNARIVCDAAKERLPGGPGSAPNPPRDFRAVATPSGAGAAVSLSWRAPSGGGTVLALHYYYERREPLSARSCAGVFADAFAPHKPGGDGLLFSSTAPTVSAADGGGLAADDYGKCHRYGIAAVNWSGKSATQATVFYLQAPPTVPQNARAMTLSGLPVSVLVEWDAPAHLRGEAVAGYDIQRRASAGGVWELVGEVENTLSHVDVPPPGATVAYRVRAVSEGGTGPFSPETAALAVALHCAAENREQVGLVCGGCLAGHHLFRGRCLPELECDTEDNLDFPGACVPREGVLPQTAETCRNFGGLVRDGVICSGLDFNDTFCIIGGGSALSCKGFIDHVRVCNGYNRPALDMFHCAGVCEEGYRAWGAGCEREVRR